MSSRWILGTRTVEVCQLTKWSLVQQNSHLISLGWSIGRLEIPDVKSKAKEGTIPQFDGMMPSSLTSRKTILKLAYMSFFPGLTMVKVTTIATA